MSKIPPWAPMPLPSKSDPKRHAKYLSERKVRSDRCGFDIEDPDCMETAVAYIRALRAEVRQLRDEMSTLATNAAANRHGGKDAAEVILAAAEMGGWAREGLLDHMLEWAGGRVDKDLEMWVIAATQEAREPVRPENARPHWAGPDWEYVAVGWRDTRDGGVGTEHAWLPPKKAAEARKKRCKECGCMLAEDDKKLPPVERTILNRRPKNKKPGY